MTYSYSDCFGLKTSTSTLYSDIASLRGDSFTMTSIVKSINVCGTTTTIQGIQMILIDSNSGVSYTLTPMG